MIEARPARLDDLRTLTPMIQPRMLAALTYQIGASGAVTFERGGEVLAMAGLYPDPDFAEVWFLAVPELRNMRREAVAIVRKLDLLLWALPPEWLVVCCVLQGHETGLRLVRMLGFTREIASRHQRFRTFALATR